MVKSLFFKPLWEMTIGFQNWVVLGIRGKIRVSDQGGPTLQGELDQGDQEV